MKKLLFILLLLTFYACYTTNKITTVNDDFKKESKIYIKHRKVLNLFDENSPYISSLATIIWQVKKVENTEKLTLLFELNLKPSLELENEFYIRTNDTTANLLFSKIKTKPTVNSWFDETKERKNDSLTIITKTQKNDVLTNYKTMYIINDKLKQTILKSQNLIIRIYIDDNAYDIKYYGTELSKIKKLIASKIKIPIKQIGT